MNRRIEALQHQAPSSDEGLSFNLTPPFNSEIMQEPTPANFKLPQLDSYDGSADPMDHLITFRTRMLLQQASDAILYRAFPSTLKEAVRDWYLSLQPGSIRSFGELSRSFAVHFISSKRRRRSSDFLINIKQQKGKSLYDYVGRFNTATLEVQNLDQFVALIAMKYGLQRSQFLFSL